MTCRIEPLERRSLSSPESSCVIETLYQLIRPAPKVLFDPVEARFKDVCELRSPFAEVRRNLPHLPVDQACERLAAAREGFSELRRLLVEAVIDTVESLFQNGAKFLCSLG